MANNIPLKKSAKQINRPQLYRDEMAYLLQVLLLHGRETGWLNGHTVPHMGGGCLEYTASAHQNY